MATTILTGSASGPVLASREGLSFWGGIDPATGRIIDAHHPLHGASILGKILLLPTTRGSCTGSGAATPVAAAPSACTGAGSDTGADGSITALRPRWAWNSPVAGSRWT